MPSSLIFALCLFQSDGTYRERPDSKELNNDNNATDDSLNATDDSLPREISSSNANWYNASVDLQCLADVERHKREDDFTNYNFCESTVNKHH